MYLTLQCTHCSSRRSCQQQNNRPHFHRYKWQAEAHCHNCQRNHQQLHEADPINPLCTQCSQQVCLCHADTRCNHRKRCVQVGNIAHSLHQQARHWKLYKIQNLPNGDSDKRMRTQHFQCLFDILGLCQLHDTVCPREQEENRQERSDIETAICPEQST